jgi:2-keto-4-pentenoate hydratase/2-oxohepta-3-ene-1,7-dioic acid hydratase in catechol pathway
MRLCRFEKQGVVEVGLFAESEVIGLAAAAGRLGVALDRPSNDLLDFLPPEGKGAAAARSVAQRLAGLSGDERRGLVQPATSVKLLTPIPMPKKVILLAGNYAEHIREGGGQAPERQETFPYFFWKPPSTTLTNPGDPIRIPAVSPHHVDWELELGVVIGKRCSRVGEAEALKYVAGYTVCNDISDRKFQINPGRKKRDKDGFFDWLHGKWHDTFLPAGPCILAADPDVDPQQLAMKLRVNGQTMQDASTAQMIFPVAALVSILSSFVTLEPGDLISTGTPSGIGSARKPPIYLKAGDVVEAEIAQIGVLRNPVVAPVELSPT